MQPVCKLLTGPTGLSALFPTVSGTGDRMILPHFLCLDQWTTGMVSDVVSCTVRGTKLQTLDWRYASDFTQATLLRE